MVDERKMNIGGELYENYRRNPIYLEEVLVYCHLMLLAKYY
jgi:hypothetical protein